MKKILSLLLSACMLFGLFAAVIPAGAITYGYMKGDADDNGLLSIKDVLLVRKYIAGLIDDKDLNTVAADLDEDSRIALPDVLKLRKTIAGLEELEENNSDGRYKINTITIDSKNIGRYTIIVPNGNECMDYSAKELRNYIREACGISLNISHNEGSVDTYKIKYMFDEADDYSLGKEGYRVAVEANGDLSVYCGSMRGPLYATYFILEEVIGYRFLFGKNLDGSDFDPYLYKADRIDIPMGYDETEVPELSYRAASQGGCTSFNFAMMRTNAVDGKGSGGSCGQKKYGGGVGTAVWHGHSYMWQVEGITDQMQPCLCNESTYEQVLAECVGQITWRSESGQIPGISFTQLSVSPNDNTNFCKCTNCMAIYTYEGSIAGTVFRLSNRVAEKLEEMYGDIEVFTIAYWDARNPPKHTRPRENVCVCFCVGGCNNHPYDQTELCAECGGNPRLSSVDFNGNKQPQSNVLDIGYYERWTELTDNIYIWYYSANFNYYIAPAPNVFNIYNDFRYLASTGTEGIYSEGSSRPYYSFEYLRGYLVSKMMWNPFMSEEEFNAHLNEYLMLYYGAGWENIRTFLEMTDHASDLNGCWTNNFDRPWNMYNEQYFLENYHTMRDLLDNAYAAAETAEQKNRVKLLNFHCDFLGLSATYESDYLNGDASAKAYYTERYHALYDLIAQYGLSITSYGTESYPESRNDIKDPMKWIFDDFTGYWEWNGTSWQ